MSKRVLLLYITKLSGHHKASLAIEQALKSLDNNIETLCVNSFNYTNPILEKIINRTYMGIIRRTPEVWEYLYDNPKVVKNTQALKAAMHKYNSKKLKKLLNDFKPDVVVATQAFPCGIVAEIKKTFNISIPIVGVLTDFYPHSYWMYENVDKYVVASDEAKNRFIEDGIAENKINIMGIPVYSKFSEKKNLDIIRHKFDLSPAKPVILIMGGGGGLGPIKIILTYLERLGNDAQIVVATGANRRLYKNLVKRAKRYKKRLIPLEYTDDIDELMQASTIIITKPGGITTSEALTKALPILIVNPIPGQEAKNAKFLVKSGAAIKAENAEDVLALTENLFSMPYKLQSMRQAAAVISRPDSALNIARMILGL